MTSVMIEIGVGVGIHPGEVYTVTVAVDAAIGSRWNICVIAQGWMLGDVCIGMVGTIVVPRHG